MLRRLTFTRTLHTLLIAAALVVSLNTLNAQCVMELSSLGPNAMVLVQSGDVSQLGDRAGYRQVIKPCGVVSQHQTIKTGADGYAKFQISDGSTFEVFPNSEVTFRKTWGLGDLLNVWLGKVKVYIQHLPNIPNLTLVPLAMDKGGLARRALQMVQDAARQVAYTRPAGSPGGTAGTNGGL